MSKPLYRIVLNEAWQVTWKKRRLWLWGLFAALLGNAGEYELLVKAMGKVAANETVAPDTTMLWLSPPLNGQTMSGLKMALLNEPFATFILFFIGLCIIAIAVFFIWLITVSVIALIKGTAALAKGEEMPSLVEGVDTGNTFFAPVFMLILFGRILNWFLLALLALFAMLAVYDILIGLPFFFVGFAILVPATFAIAFVVRYAVIIAVIKNKSILEALDLGILVFRRHWLITAELSLLLFGASMLAGLFLAAITVLFIIPILLAALTVWQLGFALWAAALLALSITSFLLVLFLTGAVLGTFQWSAWVNLYLKLQERGHLSKIVRTIRVFVNDRRLTPRRV